MVKDYAISLAQAAEPDEQKRKHAVEDIKHLQLQAVIKKYLGTDKLPIVSSRADWLGNDETHYERRWVGKDLSDLRNWAWWVLCLFDQPIKDDRDVVDEK